jgi:hypothetical protein
MKSVVAFLCCRDLEDVVNAHVSAADAVSTTYV